MKFPKETKVYYLEEFLKRSIHIKPSETLYLFVKEQRKLMVPSKAISEYAKEGMKVEGEWEKESQKILNIIVRKTDTF